MYVCMHTHTYTFILIEMEEYHKKIEDKFGKDGPKLASMKWTDYAGFVGKLNNEMTGNLQKVVGRGLLKEYSPWLVTFQPSLYPQYIEVPGECVCTGEHR